MCCQTVHSHVHTEDFVYICECMCNGMSSSHVHHALSVYCMLTCLMSCLWLREAAQGVFNQHHFHILDYKCIFHDSLIFNFNIIILQEFKKFLK